MKTECEACNRIKECVEYQDDVWVCQDCIDDHLAEVSEEQRETIYRATRTMRDELREVGMCEADFL